MKPEEIVKITTHKQLVDLSLDENYMIELSKENSEIVETAIKNDKRYQMEPEKTMNYYFAQNDFSFSAYKEIIRGIASENSTRTSGNVVGHLAKYCSDKNNRFLDRLNAGDVKLVDDMTNFVKSQGERREKSLCSKICRYLNEWYCDKCCFTINDSVVRSLLPYYLAYYGEKKPSKKLDDLTYEEFYKYFKSLRKHTQLNNHELDHLIWYAYKNDYVRVSIARALAEKLHKE